MMIPSRRHIWENKERGNTMDNIVITIARQYGSGGKTVGQMVAKELGIPFYSRDILRLASEDSGISEGLFGEADEKLKKVATDKNLSQNDIINKALDAYLARFK